MADDGTETAGGPLGIPGLVDVIEVGRGGFGTVYRAHELALGRSVAVKLLHDPLIAPEARRRFDRECRAMGLLSGHPHIVTVHRTGVTETGAPYLIMEYVAGGSLGDRLVRQGRFGWRETLQVAVKIAGALETAHQAGILHRDIKPENILMSSFGEPKLGDFGIARVAGLTHTTKNQLTASFPHVAPELLAGAPPSVRSDLYSLGSTLFTLLSGRLAFMRDTDDSFLPVLARISAEPVPDLRPEQVPHGVCGLVERLMSKDPEDRFGSAAATATWIQRLQQRTGNEITHPVVQRLGAEHREPAPTTASVEGPPPAPVDPANVAVSLRDQKHPNRRRWARTASTWLLVAALVVGAAVAASLLSRDGGRPSTPPGQTDAPPSVPGAGPTAREPEPVRPDRWRTVAPLRTARQWVSAATGSDGRIYVPGGFGAGLESHLSTLEIYDPVRDRWTGGASMAAPRSYLGVTAGHDGRIYAIGGYNNAEIVNTVEAYDPATDRWTRLAPLPTPRFGLVAVTGRDGRIYAIGGFDRTTTFGTVEVYDPATTTWTTGASLRAPRYGFAGALGGDGRIYAFGGYGLPSNEHLVEAYDPRTDSWITVAPMPTPRGTIAATTDAQGNIYVVGGYSNRRDVEVYDPRRDRWTTAVPMQTGRDALAAATGPDGRIYVIGGSNSGASRVVEAFTPSG